MKRKLFVVLLSLSIMIFSCGLIYAMVSVDVTNNFETGIVDISLTEYQIDKTTGTETLWVDNPTVLPGDIISKIPRIHNDGVNCYVRAKITIRPADGMTQENIADVQVGGFPDGWVTADDGYHYYTNILPAGEDIDIFNWVKIPTNIPEETQGKIFYVDVDVDAIQSQNFTPEFNTASPWGSVEILECEKEGQYELSSLKQSDTKSFKIEYQGDSNKLITNSDDFFLNIPYLMPGDTYSDVVDVVNDSNNAIKIYFRSASTDDSELLDKIQLKITTEIDGETKVFYEGGLRAESLSESTVLGVIPKDSNGKFNFEITVPTELNNQYSILSSNVKWIFSTEQIIVDEPSKTGDEAGLSLWGTLMGTSLAAICVLLVAKAKKKKENAHE